MHIITRKSFISGTVASVAASTFPSSPKALNIALIGCGGRGKGAVRNLLNAAKIVGCNVQVTVLCDWFEEAAKKARHELKLNGAKLAIGPKAYHDVMADKSIDAVLLVTPIGFRPLHFKAAVEAGKHVFEEKAVAVDGPGLRMHIEAAKLSVQKHLTVVAGTQRRHWKPYILQARALKSGDIAPICSGKVVWNTRARRLYMRDPAKDRLNKDYLVKNWNNFDMLAGDHVVEQHVHNIDVANWFIGRFPTSAVSFGLRARALTGNQYDFFSTEFDYGNDVLIHSSCRQINDCYNEVAEQFRTEANEIVAPPWNIYRKGKIVDLKKYDDRCIVDGSPYVAEHVDFLRSIFGIGPYFNEAEQVAMSTACGVMANFSAKTGSKVKMTDLLSDRSSSLYSLQLKPTALDFENKDDVEMPEYGDDEFKIPGTAALPRPRNPEDDEWLPQRTNT